MQYQCQTCRGLVLADEPRLTYVVRRPDGTHREWAVCSLCLEILQLSELRVTALANTSPNITPTGDETCQS